MPFLRVFLYRFRTMVSIETSDVYRRLNSETFQGFFYFSIRVK